MFSWYAMLAKWSAFHVNISDARGRERVRKGEGVRVKRVSMWAMRVLNRRDYIEASLISEFCGQQMMLEQRSATV